MKKLIVSALCTAAWLAAPPVLAQSYASHDMHQMVINGSREIQGFKPSGDMDRDFVAMMRHHHQTGVRMAEHEMQHGKDAKAREMARKIAESQKQEIKEFDAWLQARGR